MNFWCWYTFINRTLHVKADVLRLAVEVAVSL
jgi:hypothetical protein